MLSKLKKYDCVEKIMNEILTGQCFLPVTKAIIKKFFDNMTNIVFDKEELLIDILTYFNDYKFKEEKIKAYLKFAITAISLVEKNIFQLEKEIFHEEGLRIKKIKLFSDNEIAILVFTNNSEMLFSKKSILEKYLLFNNIINYLNKKITEENRLQIRGMVSCGKYGFVETSELIIKKDLINYYFKSGELLAVLYLLGYKSTKELFSIVEYINDEKFSASNVACHMLRESVYNIDFLPLDKMDLLNSNIEDIKSGFKYLYNIIANNKAEILVFIKKILTNSMEYLGNIFNKINILNEEDLKRQMFLIDARFSKGEFCKQHIIFSEDERPGHIDRERFIKLAENLGDHLIKKSIIGYNGESISRTWINSVLTDFDNDSRALDSAYNLHEGNSGLALFFLYLGVLTKKKYFVNITLEIMQESIERMNSICEYSESIVYELFTLSQIYYITKSKAVESAINKGILSIYKITREGIKDYISVSNISLILSIYDVIECNKTKKIIIDLAELLYKSVKVNHKSEEILSFLIKFMGISSDKKIEREIERLLELEKNTSSNTSYIEILLNRLKLKELGYDNNSISDEINESFNYIIENGFNENNSYTCNQEIINIEVLEYVAEVLENESLKNRCINTYNDVVNQIIEPAIYEEICYGNKSISLMNGISGYGYSLVRKCSDTKRPPLLLKDIMCINH